MRNTQRHSLLILILLAAVVQLQSQPDFAPTDPTISIMGRTLTNASGHIEFDWPGVTIQTAFTGTSCTLIMSDTKENFYDVYVDDLPVKVVSISGNTELRIAENLPEGDHTLKIVKRTESSEGKATFKGIVLDEGAFLKKIDPGYKHKIEFIGNSITCGYGTEGASKDEQFMAETENVSKSFAPITARAFHAEHHVISHSGQGVVRNYGDQNMTSEYTMPDRFKQTLDNEVAGVWDFTTWKPDVVVINLGTNDFSTEPHPIETVFNRKYTHLVKFLREQYGKIPIFCVVGPMIDEPCYSYVKKMVEANRTHLNDPNIYFVGIPKYLMVADEDLGSDWHPNYSGQLKMANLLVPVVASVTGWEYEEIK